MTKNDLISDIMLQLNQGDISDDSVLEEDQVAMWLTYHLNDLKSKEIVLALSDGNPIPPIYIARETNLELQEEDIDDIAAVKQRIYVTLSGEILDLPRDAGLVRVLDYDLNLIHKTTVENLESIRHFKFGKPSINNVLHYREGTQTIFIEGFNTADLEFNPIIVDYVKKQNVLEMNDDDEILITDQLLPILIDTVVNRGKLELYGTMPDEANDAKDTKQTSYHLGIAKSGGGQSSEQPTNE